MTLMVRCVTRVATIGYHVIYKIVDTCMLKIFTSPVRNQNAVESKLVRIRLPLVQLDHCLLS